MLIILLKFRATRQANIDGKPCAHYIFSLQNIPNKAKHQIIILFHFWKKIR